MCFKLATVALLCLCGFVASQRIPIKDKRQVGVITEQEDHESAETGINAAVHSGSKHFQDFYVARHKPEELEFGHVCEDPHDWEQRFEKINFKDNSRKGKVSKYIHVPHKDHYEHGHKRGNDHHFIERHEKAHPHAGEFKTKVRWGDKHGGYGEHYYDYNHAGHGDGDSHESQQNEEYASYEEESKHVPVGIPQDPNLRQKRAKEDVEFINEEAKNLYLEGNVQKHGGNYRKAKDFRGKREKTSEKIKQKPKKFKSFFDDPNFF